jgi:hypothetical protein
MRASPINPLPPIEAVGQLDRVPHDPAAQMSQSRKAHRPTVFACAYLSARSNGFFVFESLTSHGPRLRHPNALEITCGPSWRGPKGTIRPFPGTARLTSEPTGSSPRDTARRSVCVTPSVLCARACSRGSELGLQRFPCVNSTRRLVPIPVLGHRRVRHALVHGLRRTRAPTSPQETRGQPTDAMDSPIELQRFFDHPLSTEGWSDHRARQRRGYHRRLRTIRRIRLS